MSQNDGDCRRLKTLSTLKLLRLSSSVELNGEQLFGKNQEDQEKMEAVTHKTTNTKQT